MLLNVQSLRFKRYSSGAVPRTKSFLLVSARSMGFSNRTKSTLLQRRLELWDEEHKRQEQTKESDIDSVEMTISMLGQLRKAVANQSRPLELARKYNQKYAKKYAVSIVNDNILWDMQRPLPPNAKKLDFFRFDKATDPIANSVYWHSAAH
ncbi:hypothetical protein IWW36_005548, partial [Coemansia brasiliensis]